MCAGIAGQRGHRALLLEQARHPGEKIRISGGGRCNFTNLHTSPANFLSANPRFCHSALSGYTQRDFIALVESYGIAYHEKTRGQLFCDGSSRQIIDMLPQGSSATASRRAYLRDLRKRKRLCRCHRSRRVSRAVASGRHRRSFNSENGIERVRL
jgi:predicted flavoprotein YhiN